ncbi:MAG: FHA domain-containing protein, partial [Phycisphaerae bacterium]|nr:FHA domain-containing protein [Phycisphaerae bacterium]
MLLINVLNGLDRGKVFRLDESRSYIVGRQRGDIPLEDRKISRKHACIEYLEGQWTVTDLQSSHGTFINKRQVREPVLLVDGEQVQLGSTLVLINILDDVPAPAAVPSAASGANLDHTHRLLSELNQRLDAGGIQAQPDAATAEVLQLVLQRLDNLPESPQAPVDTENLVDRTEQRLRAVLQEHHQAADDKPKTDAEDNGLHRLEAAIEALPQRLGPDANLCSMLESLQARLDNGITEKLDTLVTGLVGEPEKTGRGWRKKGKEADGTGGLARKLDQLTELVANATNGQLQERYEALLQAVQDPGHTNAVQEQFNTLVTKIDSVADRLDQGPALEQIRQAVCREDQSPADAAIIELHTQLETERAMQQQEWESLRQAIESARPDDQVSAKLEQTLRLLEQTRDQQAG